MGTDQVRPETDKGDCPGSYELCWGRRIDCLYGGRAEGSMWRVWDAGATLLGGWGWVRCFWGLGSQAGSTGLISRVPDFEELPKP